MNVTPSPDGPGGPGGPFPGGFEDPDTVMVPARRPGIFAVIQLDGHEALLRVWRLFSNGSFHVLRQEQEVFNPGRGVAATAPNLLPVDGRRIAVHLADILSRFQRIAELHGATVRAVATPAFRSLPNHAHLLGHLPRVTRVELALISERDVARLVCRGALCGHRPGHRALVVDMGEEMTSVILANAEEPLALWNLAIGTAQFVEAAVRRSALRAAAQRQGHRQAAQAPAQEGSWRQQIQQTLALGHLEAIRGAAGEAILIRRRTLAAPISTVEAMAIAGAVAGALLRELAAYLRIGAIRQSDSGLHEGILLDLSQTLPGSDLASRPRGGSAMSADARPPR